MAQTSANQFTSASQGGQEIGNPGQQVAGEFAGGQTGMGRSNQGNSGVGESATRGKADAVEEPQALGIETRRPLQSAETGVVIEALEVAVLLQGAENGHARHGELVAQAGHLLNGALLEGVDDPRLLGGQHHRIAGFFHACYTW